MWKVWHDRNISNYFFYQVMEIKMKQPLKQSLNFMIFFILIAFFQVSAFAETVPDRDKKRDIRKLLEVSGILEQMDYIKEGATNSYSRMISLTYPKIPDEFWDEFNKLPGQEDMRVLMDRVVLVYSKHMSHDAIKQLIKMFSTPFWEEWKKKMWFNWKPIIWCLTIKNFTYSFHFLSKVYHFVIITNMFYNRI